MVEPKFLRPDTLALHAGQQPDPVTGARAVPIYQTTSFVFRDVDHAASLFNLEVGGHIYSRISNPTVAVFEERVAALEEGTGAVATSSGQAALHVAIATLMGAGGHIVASTSLYGGTRNMLALTLPRFGISTTFVPPGDHDGFRRAIRAETRLVLGETIGNPGGEVLEAELVHGSDRPHRHVSPDRLADAEAEEPRCRPGEVDAAARDRSVVVLHEEQIGVTEAPCHLLQGHRLGQRAVLSTDKWHVHPLVELADVVRTMDHPRSEPMPADAPEIVGAAGVWRR